MPGPRDGEHFPLTDAQAEKWLGSRFSTQAAQAFVETFELRMDGDLDVAALQQGLDTLAQRHEALAMRFENDGTAQVYCPPASLRLQLHDFSSQADPALAYQQFCQQQTAIPLDPAKPPLLRLFLCRMEPARHHLFAMAHHLIMDGWSMRILLQELALVYNASVSGLQASLPDADSWSAYVQRERQRRQGEAGQRSLAYWLAQYQQRPEPLRLPTDKPRGAQINFSAERVTRSLDETLWRNLRQVARTLKVSRFCMLLAGYYVLMHRITGQTDLVCGVPFAGAAQGSGARMLGDTDSNLPIRVQIHPQEPMAELLQRVQQAMKDAAGHQDISLGRIVEALRLPREAGRLMLLENVVTLVPSADRMCLSGLDCRLQVTPRPASAWELGFYWRELPGAVVLDVQYHSELFDPSTIHDWMQAYLDILSTLTMDTKVNAASLAFSAQQDRASHALINEQAPRDGDTASLPGLLEASFSRFAHRTAVQCDGQECSYAELDQQSRQIAHALLRKGVQPGQLVGIAMPRSIAMLAVAIAVMRCGAAYLPLDLAFPAQRLQRMVEHSGVRHIVVAQAERVPAQVLQERAVLPVAELLFEENAGGDWPQLPSLTAQDLAYVLYTSGSTGEPKGVCILHGNLVNFLCSMREAPGLGPDDAICAATTLSFDIAALELYLPLICGGRVVLANDDQHRDPEALCQLIEWHGCTVLQTTPSLIALLQEVGRVEVLRPLRLFVGGEALPLPLAQSLVSQCRELWNMYGPTETTVWSSIQQMQAGMRAVPLGQPIARTRFYVLDAQGQPSLPHALGEIWIGGAGVAQGYLHRPDLSAERFLPDPFAGDGSRMYRTGDLGRIHQGQLYFHGRVDEQIKLRGYRIEPGDIEAVAAAEPLVAECVVVARALPGGDQVLVLYLGSDADPATLTTALRNRLNDALPAYMRPQHVVVLKSLPKTANGKIDRRQLPVPDPATAPSPRRRVPPRDDLEIFLCAQWKRLLQRENIGIEDDFFDIGGYSLLAVRMFAELHNRYGVDLPLATLIEHPTIAGLAQAVRAGNHAAQQQAPADDAGRDGDGWHPLVRLRAGDARPPVFFFHAVGGNVLNYLPLLDALPVGQAVYGLQARGLDGTTPPLEDVAAMADVYCAEILMAFPAGPYLLAGGSMGGIIALEVARRLKQRGRVVAMLAMLDTYGPQADGRAGVQRVRPWRWWRAWRQTDAVQRAELRQRLRLRVCLLPLWRIRKLWSAPEAPLPAELRIHAVERANHRALSCYRVQSYPGHAVLFRTMSSDRSEPGMGWRNWIEEGLDVVELPGKHHNFIAQPALAECFREQVEASLAGAD